MRNLTTRLYDAYAAEVARVDQDGNGVVSAAGGDVDTASDGSPDNERRFAGERQPDRVGSQRPGR